MPLTNGFEASFLIFLPIFFGKFNDLGPHRKHCQSLKNHQICQKFGQKWKKFVPIFGWFRVPENLFSGTWSITIYDIKNQMLCTSKNPSASYHQLLGETNFCFENKQVILENVSSKYLCYSFFLIFVSSFFFWWSIHSGWPHSSL